MRIILIRHGEPDYTTDTLTEKGKREAELLSRRLAQRELTHAYISPLGRAQETAAYTLKKTGTPADTVPWLAEFRGRYTEEDTPEIERIPWDYPPRYWTRYPVLTDPDHWAECELFRHGNVREIWNETKQGVAEMMARYGYRQDGPVWKCEENRDDTLILFCHFAISMAVIACLQHISPLFLWQYAFTAPSSLTELVTEERVKGEVAFRCIRLGDITHLEAAGEPWSAFGLFPMRYTGVDSTDILTNGTEGHYLP